MTAHYTGPPRAPLVANQAVDQLQDRLLVDKCLREETLGYFVGDCRLVRMILQPLRLRSDNTQTLVTTWIRSTMGDRSLSAIGPLSWNAFPSALHYETTS